MNYDLHDRKVDSPFQKEKDTMMNLDDFDGLILSTVNKEIFPYSSVMARILGPCVVRQSIATRGCVQQSSSGTSVEVFVFTTT